MKPGPDLLACEVMGPPADTDLSLEGSVGAGWFPCECAEPTPLALAAMRSARPPPRAEKMRRRPPTAGDDKRLNLAI